MKATAKLIHKHILIIGVHVACRDVWGFHTVMSTINLKRNRIPHRTQTDFLFWYVFILFFFFFLRFQFFVFIQCCLFVVAHCLFYRSKWIYMQMEALTSSRQLNMLLTNNKLIIDNYLLSNKWTNDSAMKLRKSVITTIYEFVIFI